MPSALASLVWHANRVHRIPRPTFVTIASRPSFRRGTGRNQLCEIPVFPRGALIKTVESRTCFPSIVANGLAIERGVIRIGLRFLAKAVLETKMAKSSKLVAAKRGRVLLVRRKRDRMWMFPGGRKRQNENDKDCVKREIREELPKLKLGRLRLWKEVKSKNRHSGRKMSDAIFIAKKASGELSIGDKREIDRAAWRKPRGIRLTATSRYIRDKLFPK